jgi:hypothetical protein
MFKLPKSRRFGQTFFQFSELFDQFIYIGHPYEYIKSNKNNKFILNLIHYSKSDSQFAPTNPL